MYHHLKLMLPCFAFQSESGGAFKGFKGLVVPPGGGGLFGNGTSIKPLEGLSNGGSASSASSAAPAKAASEKKVTFGEFPQRVCPELCPSLLSFAEGGCWE